MRSLLQSTVFALQFALLPSLAGAADVNSPGEIHPYPPIGKATSLKPHELLFEPPRDGLARAEFQSESFHAIILKSAERCALRETERLRIQKLFPNNKVFMDRFACDNDVEEDTMYRGVNPDFSFIGVYGGRDLAEAKQLFIQMKLAKRFPGANIRKMQAVLVYP